MSRSHTPLPPNAFMACSGTALLFYYSLHAAQSSYSVGPSSATPRDEARGQRRDNKEKRPSQSADHWLSGADSYYPL
jgi:hypothetical protein